MLRKPYQMPKPDYVANAFMALTVAGCLALLAALILFPY